MKKTIREADSILDDALKKDFQLTVGERARDAAKILYASRRDAGKRLVGESLRMLRDVVRLKLKAFLEGSSEAMDYDYINPHYECYLRAVKIMGDYPRRIEDLIGRWFGTACRKAYERPDDLEVRGG